MTATREIPVSTPPCRYPFYNDLGREGDYYFNARWYDASTGRFISEDPARDGQNWYVYVTNNPINMVDPTGLETDYFGLTAGISLPIPTGDLPNSNIAAIGVYYDSESQILGIYNSNSLGKDLIPDVTGGFEVGHSELSAEELFSQSTTTMELSAGVSGAAVIGEDNKPAAFESGFSYSIIGKFLGDQFTGSIGNAKSEIAATINNLFSLNISGRVDETNHIPLWDFSTAFWNSDE